MRLYKALPILFSFLTLANAQIQPMELWYMHGAFLTSPAAVTSSKALIDQASSAGYTGLMLWDSSLSRINDPSSANAPYLKQVVDYATSKGMKVMPQLGYFGYSNDTLRFNPNWAEGQRILGAQFRVNSSRTGMDFVTSFPGLTDSSFETGNTSTWFRYNDSGLSIDTTTAHTGAASVFIHNNPLDARVAQQVDVTPWRQYHVRLWAKTANYSGPRPNLFIYDSTNNNAFKLNATVSVQGAQEWTAYDWVFNSGPSTRLQVATGLWGPSTGNLWLDDVQIEETALVYLLRRGGTPFRMYDPANLNTSYVEGTDFNPVTDAVLTGSADFSDLWHTPTPITLGSTTRLSAGQLVNVDFYAAQPLPNSQMGMCLTEAGVQQWLHNNAQNVMALMPAGSPIMLAVDEMRHMNSCAQCRAKNMTAGQLLAWGFGQILSQYQSAAGNSAQYVWGDMFDPLQNAHADYFQVEGDIAGSWTGVPSNVTIMNWNLSDMTNSLKFFAGMTAQNTVAHNQVIAGFYDPGDNDGANAARTELAQAGGVPGVKGLMYTTWNNNYGQLAAFAAAAKAAWPTYVASVAPVTPTFQPIRVDAGGAAYTDAAKNVWSADKGYTDGTSLRTGHLMRNTTDQTLYQTARQGSPSLNYSFSAPNGTYSVKLKFAEFYFTGAGHRVFNVSLNGQQVLSRFDIAGTAGAFTALDKAFDVTVTNGRITIDMQAVIGLPLLNAIEITAK